MIRASVWGEYNASVSCTCFAIYIFETSRGRGPSQHAHNIPNLCSCSRLVHVVTMIFVVYKDIYSYPVYIIPAKTSPRKTQVSPNSYTLKWRLHETRRVIPYVSDSRLLFNSWLVGQDWDKTISSEQVKTEENGHFQPESRPQRARVLVFVVYILMAKFDIAAWSLGSSLVNGSYFISGERRCWQKVRDLSRPMKCHNIRRSATARYSFMWSCLELVLP